MRRVWLVDDRIPIHELYGGPFPTRLDTGLVRHLVEQLPPEAWDEPAVLELCRALCTGEYESTFFMSPEAMLRALDGGIIPPHAVIFDWEYPGSNNARNSEALDTLLSSSFAYVQVYTHLGQEGVEPTLADLRVKYRTRLLPTRTKSAVTATALAEQIRNAWTGTIAGELADRVRDEVFSSVERALIDMCEVGRGALAAMTQGAPENFVHVVLSKVRDEIGSRGSEALDEIVAADHAGESSEELRRLMSVWYYYFPSDQLVRRGDLIEIEGDLGFVVTPPCDLVKFPKKTGRRLTWLRAMRLDDTSLQGLRASGLRINEIGNSTVAAHGGDALVLLPNVPMQSKSRESVADYAILCHAWESRVFKGQPDGQGGVLSYTDLEGITRRCTLAEPFASAIVARVTAVISSPGTPDFPKGEIVRLRRVVGPKPAAAAVVPPQAGQQA